MHIDRSKIKQNRTKEAEPSADVKPDLAVSAEEPEAASKKPETPEQAAPKEAKHSKKTGRKAAFLFLAAVLVLLLAGAVYKVIMDRSYAPSDKITVSGDQFNVENNDNQISVTNPDFAGAEEKTGLVIYSDLQVEPECYLPLMYELAAYGYDCYLPKAFGNQPALNIVGADTVIRKYPEVDHWYLIGHSRGCDYAASYSKNHTETVEGVLLLGGLSGIDLTDAKLNLLSLFGSNDTVTSDQERLSAEKNYPENRTLQIIAGGNNTGFISTDGLLSGDSKADISAEEQIRITARLINDYLSQKTSSDSSP